MSENRLIIGMDLDECLYGLVQNVIDLFVRDKLITKEQASISFDEYDFWNKWGMPAPVFWEHFCSYVKAGEMYWAGYVQGEPSEALMWLATIGDLYLLTARTIPGCELEAKQATHHWLQQELGPVAWTGVLIESDKRAVNADIFFDDSTANLKLLEEAGTHAVAISRPWNQDWHGDRVDSVEDIPAFLGELSESLGDKPPADEAVTTA